MQMKRFGLIAFVLLAACGADGEPIPPTMNTHIGVAVGSGGYTSGGIGLSSGPLNIFLGF